MSLFVIGREQDKTHHERAGGHIDRHGLHYVFRRGRAGSHGAVLVSTFYKCIVKRGIWPRKGIGHWNIKGISSER